MVKWCRIYPSNAQRFGVFLQEDYENGTKYITLHQNFVIFRIFLKNSKKIVFSCEKPGKKKVKKKRFYRKNTKK